MKVYLAGPMRGIPHFNFPAFHRMALSLRGLGHEVFSPAGRDNARLGVDISEDNTTGDPTQAAIQHGFSLREALAEDLQWICLHAEVVAALPGWVKSKGARAEIAVAEALGLEVWHL